ncbi:MAG TPA: prepilin-type N-terminal cleavage/methylation domain-containing protein [Candidatus Saccharimonadales bacterium]|nr:prepilin-type N-terminal cleavage/methylation domain-containing protein [Candidatus Saccharimonadales bacterium]
MLKQLRKRTEGFTIIEVMIVLAIAGLILLIVFLAVPALQRNSRNTALRNAAGNVLAGVNEFIAANNGKLPTKVGPTAADGTVPIGVAPDNIVTAKVKVGTTVASGAFVPAAALGTISVGLGQQCNGLTAFKANTRAVAASFNLESGSAKLAPQCIES